MIPFRKFVNIQKNSECSSYICYAQVTFRAPAELQIWCAVSYGPLAQLGSAHYPLLYHFWLFIHIPVPDSVPPCISCFRYLFVPNPKPQTPSRSTSHHIPLVLFLFPLLFPTLCLFPTTLICSL